MTKQIAIGPLSQIPAGEGRSFQIDDCEIAVFRNRDGAVFASQARCPHRQGPLADGLVGGSTLVCPLHEWRFDLTTGKSQNGTCDLQMYPIAMRPDGALVVELPGSEVDRTLL